MDDVLILCDSSECSNNVDVQRRETEDEELCSPTSDIKVVCHANEGNSVIIPTGNVIMHHARNRRYLLLYILFFCFSLFSNTFEKTASFESRENYAH